MPKRKPQQKWNKANVWAMIEQSDKALIRGLERLHSFQTAEEQQAGVTVEDNGQGFNGVDAEFLTGLVMQHRRWPSRDPERYSILSDPQLAAARKAIRKYCGQLAKYANSQEPNNGFPPESEV
jgi:hypothetical protein